jgi:ectoine hydroxylase-related dioxygenase (phytanoyl-CoA dioxygenase family)
MTTETVSNLGQLFEAVGVTENTLSQAEKKALDTQGYLIVPGLLDRKWLDQLRAAFERLLEEHEKANGNHARQATGTRHVDGLGYQGELFERVYTHPKLLAVVRHILGEEFRFGGMHGRDPLPGFGQQGLHADAAPRTPHEPFQVVTSLWALDDFTLQNGATRLVPGTHLELGLPAKDMRQPGSQHPRQILATAPAGSAIIFNGHLWHSGTQNNSKGHRRALQCIYLAPTFPHFSALEIEIPASLSPAARFVMGGS